MPPGQPAIITTFCLYLLLMFAIGVYACLQTRNLADYILGGRRLGRWTAALSAGASDMSGWLLLGLPGFAYAAGFDAIWIAAGLLAGTWLNWILVAPRLREYSEALGNAITLPEFFEYRFRDTSHGLRLVSAFFILFFYVFYTSSGLVAGGKLFESVFGLSYSWAVITGTLAILIYTVTGGFLAVSWTDLFQGLLMAFALVLAALVAMAFAGGWSATLDSMRAVDPALTDIFHTAGGETLSVIMVISLLGWGLGYFGQPHILVRFMAIHAGRSIPASRRIAVTWTAVSLAAALVVGFTGVDLIAVPLRGSDTEKVFIEVVTLLFQPVPAGICLAAILAAIMSTADSQLLVASSTLTEDIYQSIFRRTAEQRELVRVGRITVTVLALIASLLALRHEQKVLDLVAYAWAGFGAAFGPVLLLALHWQGMTRLGAVTGMITGSLTVILWHRLDGGMFSLYELVPGFFLALLTGIVFSLIEKRCYVPTRKSG
jgi:sodium/proline symporter